MGITNLWRAWKGLLQVLGTPISEKCFVFYAEDEVSWCHFEGLIAELAGEYQQPVLYLTSSPDDPVLSRRTNGVTPCFIGSGIARVVMFLTLQAELMIMTMPDLETFEIKRSRRHPVRYVYVFHSMVSTQMIYRRGAFDHFDAIFCVGPHHMQEIRCWEQARGLPAKQLVEHGYGRLDTLRRNRPAPPGTPNDKRPVRVLVAPSWGPNGLLETRGEELISHLLEAGFEVVVRPHPMTCRIWPKAWASLSRRFRGCERIGFDEKMASSDSLEWADVMVSDWSGAALEFAFARQRPVLFVDVPRKVNNPDYKLVKTEPIEVLLRTELGEIITPDALPCIKEKIAGLMKRREEFRERIRSARDRTVYHLDRSGRAGAEALLALQNNPSQQTAGRAA